MSRARPSPGSLVGGVLVLVFVAWMLGLGIGGRVAVESAARVPEWVPIHPAAALDAVSYTSGRGPGGVVSASARFPVAAAAEEVLRHYEELCREAGATVGVRDVGAGHRIVSCRGWRPDRDLEIHVTADSATSRVVIEGFRR